MAFTYNETNNAFFGVNWTSPTAGPGGATGPITITQDGAISHATLNAMSLIGGYYTLIVNGQVRGGTNGNGIHLGASMTPGVHKITIGDTGNVSGYYGIQSFGSLNIKNAGTIAAHGGLAIQIDLITNETLTLVNSGTILTDGITAIYARSGGLHTITNTGSIIGEITLVDGTQKLTNGGWIQGLISLGENADTLTNSGTITELVDCNGGDDVITNSGTISGNVTLDGGNNKLTNSGEITGIVTADTGNDTVKNSGHITGYISLSYGDDSFTGGNFTDEVWDDRGKDSYSLGGGNDIYRADYDNILFFADLDGTGDKVDGGTNSAVDFAHNKFGDIYDAAGAASPILLNADSKTHGSADDSSLLTTLAAGTAKGNEIGLDKISNFESYVGGTNNDIFFGGAKAEYMNGDLGNDHLHGGGGNDFLYGWDGIDVLSGDLGADVLTGGSGSDHFMYNSVKDSTTGRSGRDTITDYNDAQDTIWFKGANFAGFHMNTGGFEDSAFDGTAGALRALKNTEGWLLQYDSNGDKKVDMSIQVNDAGHATSWNISDFVVF